eukprot:CAMPEP_0197526478 /NCGR_PEP_ID=MMETSP1318-20131121/17854_1 /TAXON_ID=552666 /ORGANISM="Partenskyella glossopodia, Strain RCC365" /LENGTH=364 /DNA_ID=CAMNT_0043080643 /DNA_START=316 /DNA_END=1414 /DNA_ORIENTATION=-
MSLDITRVALPKSILDKDAKESETDMKQEMLRFNRWKRTVSKIEEAFSDGVPKINLDELDTGDNIWPNNKSSNSGNSSNANSRSTSVSTAASQQPLMQQPSTHSIQQQRQRHHLHQQQLLSRQLLQQQQQQQLQQMQTQSSKLKRSTKREVALQSHEMKLILDEKYVQTKELATRPRRVQSLIGTEAGFYAIEASLMGKNAESFDRFERNDESVNPSIGGGFNRILSFKSAKSGEAGTLFDFSTANTDQRNLILGALPLMPPKPKEKPKKKDDDSKKDGKKEGEGDEGDSNADSKKAENEENDGGKDGESGSKKDGDTDHSSEHTSTSSRKSTEDDQNNKEQDKLRPIEDENGNIREYTAKKSS